MKKTVFVSSTFEDLADHRRAVWQLLEDFDAGVSTCGAVIGVLESNNINTRLNEIEKNIITLLAQINQKLVVLQFH